MTWITIYLRNLQGNNTSIQIDDNETVLAFEQIVQTREGLPTDQQTLVFQTNRLDFQPNLTLSQAGVTDESTIVLASHPASGSGQGANPSPACFLKGTLIGTPEGDLPIEAIKEGDWVFFIPYARFQNGRTTPSLARVKWVGRKHVPAETLIQSLGLPTNLPVRLRQGALDGALPHADLCVTGHHRVLAQAALTPAGSLVDGEAVDWQVPAGDLELFHLEFEGFGLVYANGVACESFLDVGNRGAFDNAERECEPLPG